MSDQKRPNRPFITGKVCRNCAGRIPVPTPNNRRKIIFCCENCRKEFHRNNGISVHKLKEQVERWVQDGTRPMRAEIQALRDEVKALRQSEAQ